MKNPITLNNNLVDADKVSYISMVDSKVDHNKKPACTYFFKIVVDGKDIDIHSFEKKETERLRDELIRKCNPNFADP